MTREPNNQDDGLDIEIDVLGILQRRYSLIIFGVFLGLLGAGLFYATQVPMYESELAVHVGQRSSELTSTGREDGTGSLVAEQTLATHMELFASRRIIDEAIRKENLTPLLELKEDEKPVDVVLKRLEVTHGGKGLAKGANILRATYRDTDPDNAATILAAIFNAYKDYIDSQSRSVSAEAAELIAKALVENETAVKDADAAYRANIAQLPALVSTRNDGRDQVEDVHRMRLVNIESELATVRANLAEARSRYAVIGDFLRTRNPEELSDAEVMALLNEREVRRLMAFVDIATNRAFETTDEQRSRAVTSESTRAEYDKLLELLAKREALLERVGPGHSSVETVNRQIASIENYLQDARAGQAEAFRGMKFSPALMLANYYSVLQSDITELSKREEELLALSDEEAQMAKEVETLFMASTALRNSLDRAQSRYDEVFKRLQEINLTSDYAGFTTELIAPPLPNEKIVWPSKRILGTIGLLAGGMLGLGLALVAELTDRTFKTPEDVEKSLGSSILVHIPKLELTRLRRKVAKESGVDPMVTTLHTPRGSESETFRVLRTSILFSAKKGNHKVFMVTSPSPGDGKSTTISNLAVSLAQTGKRVLLVVADMRRPTIGSKFGIDRRPGLSDYLEDRSPLDECCHVCEQANLVICPEGSKTSVPAELLESDRFADFVAEAREAFDYVLIDCPPVLAVADPVIVAEHADGVLLTIKVEKKNRNLVQRAHEVLAEHEVNLLGVVVNATDSSKRGYGYSSYNYYGKKEYGYVAAYRSYYAASDTDDPTTPTSTSASTSSRTKSSKSKPPKSPASV